VCQRFARFHVNKCVVPAAAAALSTAFALVAVAPEKVRPRARDIDVATRRRHFRIIEAIPGGRWVLRWGGWIGVALLVVPAVALAVLAATDADTAGGAIVNWALALLGLVALVAAGYATVLALSSLRRTAELAQVLCDRSNGPVMVKDVQHRYRFVNEAGAALVGRQPVDILGYRDSELAPGPRALAYV
jgi:PAS domain-containing protein